MLNHLRFIKNASKIKNEAIAGGISAVVILLFYIVTAGFSPSNKLPSYPQPEAGIFKIDPINANLVGTLDGSWLFSEGHLVKEKSELSEEATVALMEVSLPGKWNSYRSNTLDNPSFGYGTYFSTLRIDEDDVGKIMAIKMTNIGMSNKVFINGVPVGQSGIPAESREDYTMGNVPYIITFVPDRTELYLAIQVSNFDYSPYSGIVSSIRFGVHQAVMSETQRTTAYEIIFNTSFVVVGIVYLVLFVYRRGAKYLLYFALYNFSAVIYILTHGEKLWYHLFPDFSYILFTKIQYLSAAVNLTFFLLYLLASFPILFNNRLTKIAILVSYLFYPFFLFPLSIQSLFSGPQILFFQIIMIYTVSRFVLGIVLNHAFIWFISVSALLSLFMVNEAIGIVFGTKEIGLTLIAAQLIWVMIQAFLIAIRLSITFDLVDAQAQALMKMDKQKDEFLAKTSHEFKTPLHGIINMIQLFIERQGDMLKIEDKKRLLLVIESAGRLSRLVNDLLDLSKIREGKVFIQPEWTPLKTQFQSVIEVCEFAFAGRPCEISVSSYEENLHVFVDRDRFRQVLYNIIENALNHTVSGKVEVEIGMANDEAIIGIRDFGTGISELVIDEIFKPYFQTSPDPSDSHVGLGLSIVKDLVEQLGGHIEVKSSNSGSIFILRFKAKLMAMDLVVSGTHDQTVSLQTEASAPLSLTYGEGMGRLEGSFTVLVVDDQESNRMVLEDALKEDHYRIISCADGKSAFEVIANTPHIDLVILDVMMPDYSGYEISDAIRKRYSMAELPILFITAGINMIDAERMFISGANDFLYKPFQLSELRARVKSLLSLKKAADKKAQLEIAFLNAQIKPHFLYNALNTIAAVCEDQSPEAADLIISLAKYLRGTLDFSYTQDLIPIEKEIALVSAYLKLETARFPHLKVDYAFDNIDLSALRIPPMALQVLVENAVKHGIHPSTIGERIRVCIEGDASHVTVIVEDNGIGFTEAHFNALLKKEVIENASSEESVGLINLDRRLKRMLGTPLKWYPPKMCGTRIGFEIMTKRRIES